MEKSQLRLGVGGDADTSLFNPNRLTIARKRKGYTKAELASELGVTRRAISSYESGDYPPSDATLTSMEKILGFPAEFFLGDDLDEPETGAVSFRSLSKMSAKYREMAKSQGALAIHLTKWIEERFELPSCALPDLGKEPYPEAAAESLRQDWGIGQSSIKNMIHLLESKGIRVFSLSVDAREVDAFSTWKDGVPFVFLNCFKSTEHSRFDAAHELGHLVMHKHGGPAGKVAELEANRFASALLMPRSSVLANAPKFATIPELLRLKKIWTTSVAAVNHRLHEVGLLSKWHYQSLCIEIAKRGFRVEEPNQAPRETSLLLPKVFSSLHLEDGLTRPRIAHELRIPESELEALLFSLVMTGVKGGRPRRLPPTKKAAALSLIK